MKPTDKSAGLTLERVKELLEYNPISGVFVWLPAKSYRSRLSGKIAGNIAKLGYMQIKIDGRLYFNHRLAWFYMTSVWPTFEIDHKDRQRANNAWNNLREATHAQNQCNAIRVRRELPRGVYLRRGKYRAQLRKDGKLYNLGTFQTAEAAHTAFNTAATKYHGEFCAVPPTGAL